MSPIIDRRHDKPFRGVDAFDYFLTRAGHTSLLSPVDELKLAKRVAAGDQTARRRLFEANVRLVISIAKTYRGRGVEFEDLIQDGTTGLHRATELFDPALGFKFSTYATRWIHQSIQRGLDHHGRMIAVPGHVAARRRILRRVSTRLEAGLGRPPTPQELANETGIQLQHVIEALALLKDAVSLDVKPADHEETIGASIIDAALPDVDEKLDESRRRQAVTETLDTLPALERQVLQLRFGIVTPEPQTLTETAKALGVSVFRVKSIEARALERLRPRLGYLLYASHEMAASE